MTGSGTTYFVYDEAGHLVGEYDGAGALVQETVWLGDIPVATLRPNGGSVGVYYVHTDHLNSPRRISRPSDNVIVWRWDSDPFGTTAASQDPDGDSTNFVYNHRFPGQYYDAETGLDYNYFRDYDAQTGRYVESDPIGLKGGINTYAYAGSDAIDSHDPDGLIGRRRIGDPDVTRACSYYDDACRRSGGKCNYSCKTAPFLCRNPDMIPSLWVGVTNSQIGCIRTCLIEEDKKAQQDNSSSASSCENGRCLTNDVINDYHKTCYTKCGVGVWRFPGVGPFGN